MPVRPEPVKEATIPRLTQIIIALLFTITALSGLLTACLGIIFPGVIIMLVSAIGIWATLNSK